MKKIISTSNAPAPIGPYNQAVFAGETLYISGQIPLNPKTGELVSGDIAAETKMVMQNLKAILTEAGLTFENVIKIKPYCKWIWLEIFKNIKITKSQKNFIKKNKIKICLVSPELHNKPQNLNKTKNYIKKYRLKISAICTKYKYKNKWES